MLSSNAALRPCVRLVSHRPHSLITPTTRSTFTPVLPWIAPQRTHSHFRRLLGTGWNSLRGKKRVAPKRKTAKTGSIQSKPSRQSRAHSSPAIHSSATDTTTAAVLTNTSTLPTTSSQNHHDRRSFLRWAKKTGLSENSTYYIGTLFEYTVLEALKKKNFVLTRCGGPNDWGIDLTGTWKLPGPAEPLNVLIQCKAGRPSANTARDLLGACSGGRPEWREEGVMAWLASPKALTKSTWQAIQRSPRAMGYMRISKDGLIQEVSWNDQADKAGLRGLSKKDFYVSPRNAAGKTKRPKRVVEFTWNVTDVIVGLVVAAASLCMLGAIFLALFVASVLTITVCKDAVKHIARWWQRKQTKSQHLEKHQGQKQQLNEVTHLLPNTWHEHEQALPEEEEQYRRGWWRCSVLGNRKLVSNGGSQHSGWFWSSTA